jgi:hypothetical protein
LKSRDGAGELPGVPAAFVIPGGPPLMDSSAQTHDTDDHPPLPPVKLDPLAALFSYLIPGMGQVYQGRVGKGLLFFFGLYLLFFYGMWMGHWRNVWLPDARPLPPAGILGQQLGGVAKAISYRPQFLAQFWIGVAAWPAVYQYINYDPTKDEGPVFGKFQRTPTEDQLNDLQRNSTKRWDLGWVYTVIAGVLNLLVIYDAFAGPMFRDPPKREEEEDGDAARTDSPTPMPLPPPPPPPGERSPYEPPAPFPPANPQQGGTP